MVGVSLFPPIWILESSQQSIAKSPTIGRYEQEIKQGSDLLISSRGSKYNPFENDKISFFSDLAAQYGWDRDIAYEIIIAESGGNPNAENLNDNHRDCVGSFGVWQLGCIHGTVEELKDPVKSTEIAYNLYKQYGWQIWSVCLNKLVNCY